MTNPNHLAAPAHEVSARNGRANRFVAKLAVAGALLFGAQEATPSPAEAKIVPGVGIAGVKLFDGYGPVRSSIGYPDNLNAKGGKHYGTATWTYRKKPLEGFVKFIDINVHSIITRSKTQKTSKGIGPGSSYNATVRAYPDADYNYLGPDKANAVLTDTYKGEEVRTTFTFEDDRMVQAEVTELSDHINK